MKNIFDFFKFQLNEMLMHTLSPDQTWYKIDSHIHFLNKEGFEDENDYILYFKGKVMIIELKNNYEYNDILSILSEIFSTGYFVSRYFLDSENIKSYDVLSEDEFLKYWKNPKYKNNTKYNKDIIKFKLYCEPKWDNSISINDYIYHITNSENTENILKYGLLPASGKKISYHPDRVYFSKNIEETNIILNIAKKIDKRDNKQNSYDLLKIDTTNLKSFNFDSKLYDIKFYEDPNSKGIYTYDRIMPENIVLLKTNI